jgi:hypothetical protein
MNKTNINLSYTSIKAMGLGSSMSLSKVCSFNKNVTNKRNSGFGEEAGDQVLFMNGVQWVDDRDMVDSDTTKKTNR